MYCIAAFLYSPLSIPILGSLYGKLSISLYQTKIQTYIEIKKISSKNLVIEYITTKIKI